MSAFVGKLSQFTAKKDAMKGNRFDWLYLSWS